MPACLHEAYEPRYELAGWISRLSLFFFLFGACQCPYPAYAYAYAAMGTERRHSVPL